MPEESKNLAVRNKATRNGYTGEVVRAKAVYLRRAHPKDPPELVISWGDHTCTIIPLSAKDHEGLTRDSHALWFTKAVLA